MTDQESPPIIDTDPQVDFPQAEDEPSEITQMPTRSSVRFGLALAVVGYLMFLLGARPSIFGLDRSRVIGFVQISVFLVGLAIIIIGSYLALNSYWRDAKKTIAADIGSRLISTGYVICVFTSMADIFGMGSHRLPDVFFGPLQARGMSIGMITIAIGFLLMIRYKHPEEIEDQTPKFPQQPNGDPSDPVPE